MNTATQNNNRKARDSTLPRITEGLRSIEEDNKLIFEEALGNLSNTLKNNKFIK